MSDYESFLKQGVNKISKLLEDKRKEKEDIDEYLDVSKEINLMLFL